MLGGSEYVAEACEETLQALGHKTQIHLQPNLAEISTKNQTWLICTSTHGAGDYPDNIIQFVSDLRSNDQDLSSVKLLTIGIGDSNYDTFCYAAINIKNILISSGCTEISPIKLIDMSQDIDPELDSQTWIDQIRDLL